MKRKQRAFSAKCIFSMLLALVLTLGSCPLSAAAAPWSQKKIISYFPSADAQYYNETQFLMKSEEMVYFIAGNLGEDHWEYGVIYDDEDSTATRQEYILSRRDTLGKNGANMLVGINMDVNKKDDVLSVEVYVDSTAWEEDQLTIVMEALTDIYAMLNGSMTREERQQFVTDRNISEEDSVYRAYGVFDGLYYEFKFSDKWIAMTMKPMAYADVLRVYGEYEEGYELISGDEFSIRTGKLAVNSQGDITVEVDLINQSRNPLLFQSNFARVNQYDIGNAIFSEVGPGNTRTEQIHLDAAMLSVAGIDVLEELGLFFKVTDQKTREVLFDYGNYITIGLQVRPSDMLYKKSIRLFQNEEFSLHVLGSGVNPQNGRPQIYLTLDNGVYGYIQLSSEGTCVIDRQEYDLFLNGYITEYSPGVATLQPSISHLGKTTTLEFDLVISSYNYNDLVAGHVTVKLDRNGKILSATSKMKETFNYADILKKEY